MASSKTGKGKSAGKKSSRRPSLWHTNRVTMFVLIVLSWIFGLIILFSFGMIGRFLQEVMQLIFGSFSYVLILGIMAAGLHYVWTLGNMKVSNRMLIGLGFFALFWMLSFGIAATEDQNSTSAIYALITSIGDFSTMSFTSSCGLIGALLGALFCVLFSRIGALIFDLAFLFISVILIGWPWWKHLLADRPPRQDFGRRNADGKKKESLFTRIRKWAEVDDYEDDFEEEEPVKKKRPPRTPYGMEIVQSEDEEPQKNGESSMLIGQTDPPLRRRKQTVPSSPEPHQAIEEIEERPKRSLLGKWKRNRKEEPIPADSNEKEVLVDLHQLKGQKVDPFSFLSEDEDDSRAAQPDAEPEQAATPSRSGAASSKSGGQILISSAQAKASHVTPEAEQSAKTETVIDQTAQDTDGSDGVASSARLPRRSERSKLADRDPSVFDQSSAVLERSQQKGSSSKKVRQESLDLDSQSNTYTLPPVSLLQETRTTKRTSVNQKKALEQGQKLIDILGEFGVEASLGEIHIGPSVTEFEVIPGQGVRVNAFVNLQSDIKLALAAKDIRVEAPIPGKSAVGIEVPNEEKTTVSMKELITQVPARLAKEPLVFTLGKDLMGNNIYGRLDTMPHLLIAGATGSGKSVCVNSIICSLLLRTRPEEVRLLLIDPKKVEFTPFNGLPHLLAPVITDAALASGALKIIVDMMDERYSRFEAVRVRNLAGYNEYVRRHPKEELEPMPRIVVIIDELADLMLAASKDVEQSIQRITQLARAAGIHLIVATQRPSVNVITGVIKANIPSRIAFMVSSRPDSRTILDQSGAEKLLGYGDMLFLDNGAAAPKRIQGVFIQDQEVEAICDFVRSQGSPEYEEPFLVLKETKNNPSSDDDSFEEDPLYEEVRHFVVMSRKASTSLIQRRFRIGYARAARILDQLEANRIIGPGQGSRPREILIPAPEDDQLDI